MKLPEQAFNIVLKINEKLQEYFSKIFQRDIEFTPDIDMKTAAIRFRTESFTLEELSKITKQQIVKTSFFTKLNEFYCMSYDGFGYFEDSISGDFHVNIIRNDNYAIIEHPFKQLLLYDWQENMLYLKIINVDFLNLDQEVIQEAIEFIEEYEEQEESSSSE